ncbi:ATP-binding cassette sub-family A member 12 isoform X2 [Hippoglossus hippoglossus]|uniref:ATP-binding cassette sub-family A member 12 isoform X2 n=1 Tax=Hippoglossus hippoglossus TaxID=8267 RepID=UPI00148B7D1B|nr:ATP-binding cassette sub-family A member 12 isoform X2 [Hippoglossus hippoglossus]
MLIGQILKGLCDIIEFNLEAQKNMMGPEEYFNSTALNAIAAQIKLYLNVTQEWMKQPNVPLIFTSMLQWGNSSINISTPVTDIQHLLQTTSVFLNESEVIYLSAILNIMRSLEKALMVAERPGGLQSDPLVAAIVEGVKTTMALLIGATGPLPHSVQQDILDIVQDSLKLIVLPDKNFDSSRNISLLILKRAQRVVQTIIPEMYAVYIIPGIKVATTFFESASGDSGPDIWNHMILSELKTIESLLPPNSTARAYISVVINITGSILESGQGNMSLWARFERASLQDVPMLIGQILKGLCDIIEFNLEAQKNMMGPEEYFNSTALNAIAAQIKLYLNVTQEWMKQPNVPLIFTSMLQWGNSSINISTPVTDIQHLLQTTSVFLNESEVIYLSAILNIMRSLEKALMVAERPGGLQSDPLVAAIVEGVKTTMALLIGATGPLPHSVQQDILDIVQDSLKLIVLPDKNFDSSRNISLLILKRAQRVVQTIIPEMYAVYIIPGIKVATTFFESASGDSGPDIWNHMILSELKTIESLLPPNSTARAYISVVINIAHSILESGQGNMSLWARFERASLQDVPMLIGQLGRLVSMFFMGMPDLQQSIGSSMGVFTRLSPLLEQLMSGKADQHMWDNLEKMLQSLLSSLEGTELWHNVSSVVPLFEKILGSLVNNMQAQNVLLLSLQTPVVTLMREVARSVNTSHFNLSEVTERIQAAIEHTLQAAQQANGTLGCRESLRPWEPVREGAGLSPAFMAMWCNISLQPVIEAYAAAMTPYSHINMTHMGVGPTTVNATAARIAETMQALYHVIVNQSLVTEQLISAFSMQLGMLAGRPLSPEAQLYWNRQLQDIQLQNSLSSIKMLTDELRKAVPSLQPYIEAVEKAMCFFIINSPLLQNSSTSQDLLKQTAMIFLTSANITAGDIFSAMSGNVSGLNEASIINAMREVVKLMADLKILGDDPMVYRALEQILASNDTALIVRKVVELTTWLGSTRASGLDLLMQVVHRMYDILRSILSLLTKLSVQMPENSELFEDLAGNVIGMLKQLLSTPGLLSPMHRQQGMSRPQMASANHSMRVRHKREAQMMRMRDPMDDFIDLFYIDYHSMSKALNVAPTTGEILETVHMFFANPDLSVVLKGVTSDMPWGMNASREETIDAALVGLSLFTLPSAFQMSSEDLLMSAVAMLTDAIPFSPVFKNITRALANESQEILMLMQQTIQTAAELFQSNMTDQQLKEKLTLLRSQVCALENTETMNQLLWLLSIERGQLCRTILPSLQILAESLLINASALTDAVFQSFIGEPKTYNIDSDWTSVLGQGLGFNTSNLRSLNINVTSPGAVTVGELLRDKAAFVQDVQRHMDFDPAALHLLMGAVVPNNNLEILSWLVNLRQCNSTSSVNMKASDAAILKTFCSMSAEQWYSFSLLMVRHLNMEKLLYRVVLSEEMQSLVVVMLQIAETLTDMMNNILPTINTLQSYLLSIQDLNLMANNEFNLMSRGDKSSISTKATFVTISRALCSNGIMALFGISKLPPMSEPNPSFPSGQWKEEMIDRFKIPRNATPFCTNMYLEMVNTTGGAIAWAFLKPMLMGKVLYTPDTPITRDIMEKANATLQEFANLRKNSQDWIQSSNYIINSAELLSNTLPMLQNSLSNSFVKNFIEMQTDIDVGRMKDTLSSFSNMTVMLEKNKQILNQITTLSTLMVDLSSCIKFDRYRGYDSAEQLNHEAQELAKDRNLYASVIFKLPKDDGSTKNRHARSSSNTSSESSLPPQVSYTIRMHMDNVMRTDRVREAYFVKDPHLLARQTMRYNRGFVYLQENIDRAIIESQTGKRVTEPAVQLQPFPYPCHLRDEYLEAISFVFPIMLMLAWVLFIADFVKKLVHERELRLHEYMKMMGVNPLSHFFAWFVECATYLGVTIIILTLVLKYGKILPNSDGFLMFLYLCDYGLSIIAFSFLVSSFFDKTYIAGLSGSLLYILCFFPFIVVMSMETKLTFSQKSAMSLFSPTCFSYASQYVSRYEAQGEGIQWSNAYMSPIAGDTASFGWLCWMMLIDSMLYFIIGAYIRKVFPGKYGIPSPWYFPFKASFWADLCCCIKSKTQAGRGLLFNNIMQNNQPVFSNDKEKGKSSLSFQAGEDFSELPVGVALHSLSKMYADRVAIQNLNVSFHEGHVTSLLGHNGAGKTTTMSLLTGLFAPTSGTIEVYGRDMQSNIDDIRKELGVCMQYDVLFDHMTTKEHLLLYGQIKAPHWSKGELHEQVRSTLEETGMYAHRHKRVGTLSGGMKRKLSISIAFIGGSRLVVLDEPTTGVDPCSRRSIWDIVIQHKKNRTIIMSTHHLDEAEVLSDRIAFLERGGLKCCGSPFHLKDKLGQGYKLTLTKKLQNLESEVIDSADLKQFIQAHVPEARLKEAQGGDLVYSLPPFTSANASSYRSLLTALDSNLDALQLGGYGICDTTLEEVFLQLTHDNTESESVPLSISETISDTGSVDSFPSDNGESLGDKIKLTGSSMVSGMALAWQQMSAILIKRFHHSRRDWKGLIAQILLPVLFVVFAMGLGSIKSDLRHYPELELSPALYNIGPSYSFFRNQNPSSGNLVDSMMSFPGMDNACLDEQDNPVCARNTHKWSSRGNSSKGFSICKCTRQEQVCAEDNYQPPHEIIPSSQVVYNLSGINLENYLVATANDFIRNRYGGFDFGMQLPTDLQMDLRAVPKNRTLSKVWFNPEGHHTMPAYLNSLSNLILRSNLPADKDPRKYAISVSSHPYFGRADDEDAIVQGMLQILVAVCVLTGYSIMTASFAIYEVHEHHSGSKRLQHIAGISEPFYWAVNFLYDMVIYMIPVTLTICVIAAFQVPAFTDRQNLGAVTLLLVLFGFSTFPWMYLLSGVFKDAEMAFITYVCINLFISVNTIMSTSVLYFLGQISMRNAELVKIIFERLSYAFLIFPQFNFGNGLMYLARKNIEVQILSGYGIDAYQNPFSTDALGWMFISSFIQGVVFFTLRLLLNKFLLRKVWHLICGRKTVPQVACEDEDEDVAAENLRVSSGAANTDILQVDQLTKIYQHFKRKVPAVKRLSVGIPAGECFGLLGVNGAGKTTTFKMLTGDVSPSDGTAQIRDLDGRLVDIMECRSKGINIGYCPQEDALDGLLTGEEHLDFYARIRGIPKRDREGVVNYLLKRLELSYHRNIITDSYSCGTRRKLSTALALIGHPQILLLDEPSSGMDPRTKRHLWKIISEEVKGKCAVVLTSHSMEECEALCSRLAIMDKGQFRCLGSLQHIKNRFGSGFTVRMYMAEASCDAEAITGFMQRRFPSTYLKDQHSTMVEYHVPVAPGGVADIFDQLESNKNALQIKHFSVSQTTLDEVFINFAMGKIGMETIPLQSEEEEWDDLDCKEAVDA